MNAKQLLCFVVFGLLLSSFSWGQLLDSERSELRKGNRAYQSGDLDASQQAYENALDKNQFSANGHFNLGNALYAKKDTNAVKHFEQAATYTDSDEARAKAYHNLGNAFMKQGKLQEGIDAYKKALRLNPQDEDTRYNLAYALEMLRKQQQQQQENQDDQDGENDENQDQNQDQQNQQDQEQEKKDQEQEQEQEDQDQQNQDQQNQDQQDQQQQDSQRQSQPQQMSKEEIEQMLEALRYQEEKLQEKIQKKKGKPTKVKGDKDW